jgi:hypothetical protein
MLRRLPRIAAVLHECGGHALADFGADARHRQRILHRDLRGDASVVTQSTNWCAVRPQYEQGISAI